MTTGEVIKSRREELGMTQVELAKRIGVSKSFVNKVERDASKLPYTRVVDFAIALSCRPAELIGNPESMDGTIMELESIAREMSPSKLKALIEYAKLLK